MKSQVNSVGGRTEKHKLVDTASSPSFKGCRHCGGTLFCDVGGFCLSQFILSGLLEIPKTEE
ncbi:hypothetical protein STEG23_001247, partial [Scotinomys teguina]